jgi:hypothetical protein
MAGSIVEEGEKTGKISSKWSLPICGNREKAEPIQDYCANF